MKYLVLVIMGLMLSGCAAIFDDGKDGLNGRDGADGSSCSVTQTLSGSIIDCEDGTSAVLLNGQNGLDGAHAVLEIIDPCNKQGAFDEVLLRLSNGALLAYFTQGSFNTSFLTLLTPGQYQTTDGTNCHFTVNSDLSVSF